MPIYEYECKRCKNAFSALLLKPEEEHSLRCRTCGGVELVRLLSRCAVHKTENQRLAEFDTRAPRTGSFYKDDRNVGLWARKRMKDLGVDLGHSMDEIVERAREGKVSTDL
jgi:putative FmdB family regulatory protein